MKKNILVILASLGIVCIGCGSNLTENNKQFEPEIMEPIYNREVNMENDSELLAMIHVFPQDDMVVVPAITEYSFEHAQQIGTVQEIDGILPGSDSGTWYIVEIDGIEYYYGKYSEQEMEEATLWGYSIISNKYSLANGISVGMTKEEIISKYPDMAMTDFKDRYLEWEVSGYQGWNGEAYPRSYVGMDVDFEYKGEDYFWINQFEYIMVADIDFGRSDGLPQYVALLMTGDTIAAITFYCPTAG